MKIKTYFCDNFENEQSTLYRIKTYLNLPSQEKEKELSDVTKEMLAAHLSSLKEEMKAAICKGEKFRQENTTLEYLYNDGWRIKTVLQDCSCKKQTFFMEQD